MALNNNQIQDVLAKAISQATGGAAVVGTNIQPLDLKDIIDNGTPVDGENGFTLTREKFTGALLDVIIRNWFKDSSYRSSYSDPWFIDSESFGAYVQAVSMEYPSSHASHVWSDFDNSTTKVGQYDLYIPVIEATIYGSTVSWEVNVTITGSQWDTAFKSEADLNAFVTYIYMMVDNAIVMHLEEMDYANRNNFIAEKISYTKKTTAKGVHVVNLVEEYAKLTGATSLTAANYLKDSKAVSHGSTLLKLYSDRFTKMSSLFNTEGKKRFTPKDRQVIEVLADFEAIATAVQGNDAYNLNIVTLPNHVSVPYWQGSGEKYDFDSTSAINIKTNDGTTVTQSGIVAILADKWAIAHTIKQRRVVAKNFEPEDLVTTFNQFKDHYSTDVSQNGVIFVVTDYTKPANK